VLWLQLTGGEPLIDRLFPQVYTLAWDLGMMIGISSNGSRLNNPEILELLTTRRPYRLTLSVFGATEDSYDGLTRRRGSFRKFQRGLAAAIEAGLPIKLNIVVARHNEHEVAAMETMARGADYTPGSPDLPDLVATMCRLAELPCPDLPPVYFRRAEQRWAEAIDDPAARVLLAGDTILHTDYNPANILITRDGAEIIDWRGPRRVRRGSTRPV